MSETSETSPGTTHVFIDLETFGTTPGSAILTLGAAAIFPAASVPPVPSGEDDLVRVGRWPQESGKTFYRRVTLKSCVKAGLALDAETILWWSGENEAALAEIWEPKARSSLGEALEDFARWMGELRADGSTLEVWGNGPSFDLAILGAAYRAVELPMPWSYWEERCVRTALRRMPAEKKWRPMIRHHALHDALAEAANVIRALAVMERTD